MKNEHFSNIYYFDTYRIPHRPINVTKISDFTKCMPRTAGKSLRSPLLGISGKRRGWRGPNSVHSNDGV